MILNDLAPANTKRAREKAARSFLKFLEEEEVTWEYLRQCMQRGRAPLALEAVMDKLGMYLALRRAERDSS